MNLQTLFVTLRLLSLQVKEGVRYLQLLLALLRSEVTTQHCCHHHCSVTLCFCFGKGSCWS